MLPRSTWLAALGAFEAAARLQNFAHAGAELHLTASAISHHVRKLEGQLGVVLFQRHARGVSLTPAGRALADATAASLGEIESVLSGFERERSAERVRITMLPSFAACWFMPRIAKFASANPSVRLTVDADRALSRFEPGGPDLGIRYGLGQYTGLATQFLMGDAMFPAAAPTLPGVKKVKTAADIAQLPLIGDLSLQGWRDWFREAGVSRVKLDALHHIADTSDAMDAAAGGLGAVLARMRLAGDHLKSGRLVRLPGPEMPTRYAYYLVHPRDRPLTPAAAKLAAFIRAEATAG